MKSINGSYNKWMKDAKKATGNIALSTTADIIPATNSIMVGYHRGPGIVTESLEKLREGASQKTNELTHNGVKGEGDQ